MADYLGKVKNLQISLKDNAGQLALITELVSELESSTTSSVTTSRVDSTSNVQSLYAQTILSYIYKIRSYKFDISQTHSVSDIDAVISILRNLLPPSPSRMAIINSLKEFNKTTPITFSNYYTALKFLQNRYGDGLELSVADDIIREFIKQDTGLT